VISASIVVYKNDAELLTKAIDSVLKSAEVQRVIVIDNSPTSALRIAVPADARVQYIHKPENIGFGRAHNLAFEIAGDSEYHIILNPDVYFGPEVIEGLRTYLDEHPDAGMVMPKVLFPDGTVQHLCKLLPSPVDLLMRRFLPHNLLTLFKDRMDQYEMRDIGYDREMRVPCLSGCFMFVRASVLREVKGFDERFFLYMEDVDLSRRIGKNYHTMYYPKVHVYHAYGKGSYASKKLRNLHIRSALTYFSKWGWFFDPEREQLNSLSHLLPTRASIATAEPQHRSS
jgi:GT2 family glycosyltransferase